MEYCKIYVSKTLSCWDFIMVGEINVAYLLELDVVFRYKTS